MPSIQPPTKVLTTGSNGYIGAWILRTLLERGFSVRAAVRAESKTLYLRQLFKDEVEQGRVEFVIVPDITTPGAFDEAVKGVEGIVHSASPCHFNVDDPDELIIPARDGTLSILNSALNHAGPQLKRFVHTSSGTAIFGPRDTGFFDESNFNEDSIAQVREKGHNASQADKYFASKTIAEKAVWEFYASHKSEITWDVSTLCPIYVFGPILHEVKSINNLNSSSWMTYDALVAKEKKQSVEGLVVVNCTWADVRDIALGHVRALEVPEAGGERFIISSGPFTWQDWFDATNELKIPGTNAPVGTPGSGKTFNYTMTIDWTKARKVLGLEYRDILTTARDTLQDYKRRGWM